MKRKIFHWIIVAIWLLVAGACAGWCCYNDNQIGAYFFCILGIGTAMIYYHIKIDRL